MYFTVLYCCCKHWIRLQPFVPKRRGDFLKPAGSTHLAAADPAVSSPPPAAPAAGGRGNAGSRYVHSVGLAGLVAGGALEAGVRLVVAVLGAVPLPFAGGVLRSLVVEPPSPSSSQPLGAAVRVFPDPRLDPRRRIWWLGSRADPWARQVLHLLPATATMAAEAWWFGGARGALARVVHRQQLRRGAADGHGGVLHRAKSSLAAARRRLVILVSGDGGGEVSRSFWIFSPSCCFFFVLCLCTVYVEGS